MKPIIQRTHSLLYNTNNTELISFVYDRFRDHGLLYGIIFSFAKKPYTNIRGAEHLQALKENHVILITIFSLGRFVATFLFSQHAIVYVHIRKEHYAILSSTHLRLEIPETCGFHSRLLQAALNLFLSRNLTDREETGYIYIIIYQ